MSYITPHSAFKIAPALDPDDFGNTAPNATQCLNIDTRGYRWATFVVSCGAIAGTSATVTVQEDDNSSMSTPTAITGATLTVFGDTSDNSVRHITIDLTKTSRWLQLAFAYSAISASNFSAVCILSGPVDSQSISTTGIDAASDGIFPA